MLTSPDPSGIPPAETTGNDFSSAACPASLAEVSALAESLGAKDQVRLIARLLQSIPAKHRAALVEFARQSARPAPAQPAIRPAAPAVETIGPTLWDKLFDPKKTSDLYSAPRRFDLATIFVVTAAYSILFGAMSALDYYFGAPTKVAVGLLVTVVAASQAYFQNIANPRGVSVVTGSIALSIILTLMKLIQRSWISEPLPVVIVIYGLLGGAFAGYLSGVLVGGVFLVADKLRKKFESPSAPELSQTSADEVE